VRRSFLTSSGIALLNRYENEAAIPRTVLAGRSYHPAGSISSNNMRCSVSRRAHAVRQCHLSRAAPTDQERRSESLRSQACPCQSSTYPEGCHRLMVMRRDTNVRSERFPIATGLAIGWIVTDYWGRSCVGPASGGPPA
jgi:hypothetical protein